MNMSKKVKMIKYAEWTREGELIRSIDIKEHIEGKDYFEDLIFNLDDELVNYYENLAGDFDSLDNFLDKGVNNDEEFTKSWSSDNAYVEVWRTELLGWYPDFRYSGLIIE